MIRFSIYCLILSFIVSCSGSVNVDPKVSNARKIALISFHANKGVRSTSYVPSISSVASKVTDVGSEAINSEDPNAKLISEAVDIFSANLSELPGWSLYPPKSLKDLQVYQTLQKELKKISSESVVSSISGIGRVSDSNKEIIYFDENGIDDDYKPVLSSFLKNSEFDAVLIIELDMAYSSGTSILGTGTAVASVGIGAFMMDKNEEFLIVTSSAADDEEFRKESNESVAMVMNEINFFDDDVQLMLKESIIEGAKAFKERLKEEF